MKKGCLLLFLLVSLAVSAAENNLAGFNVGISSSKFHGGDVGEDLESNIFITLGVCSEQGIGNYLGLLMNINYARKGGEFEVGPNDLSYQLNYLELPILLKLYLTTKNEVSPTLIFGPVFSIRAGSKIELDNNRVSAKDLRYPDFGLCVGGGINLPMDDYSAFSMELKYNYGLVRIARNSEVLNNSFKVTVNLMFPI